MPRERQRSVMNELDAAAPGLYPLQDREREAVSDPKGNQEGAMKGGEEGEAIKEEWDDQWGDRGTELVFIGRDVDEEQLIERLDECLLSDAEMDEDWSDYVDPFAPDLQQELALADQ